MPDNAPTFEPLLSKSLCSALLEMSQYFGEHSDQTMRVTRGFDSALIVEAFAAEDASGDQAKREVVQKRWSLPMDWWPTKALPDDLGKLLTFITLPDALVQLRDDRSAFSVYVQRCLAAEVSNPFAVLAEVMGTTVPSGQGTLKAVDATVPKFDFNLAAVLASTGRTLEPG